MGSSQQNCVAWCDEPGGACASGRQVVTEKAGEGTYSFLDGTEFLELLAKSGLLGVPGKAAETGVSTMVGEQVATALLSYPMKSLDMLVVVELIENRNKTKPILYNKAKADWKGEECR